MMSNIQLSYTVIRSNSNSDKNEKLSTKCANLWWKLKVNDRKSHNHLMKIQLLSPFLFCKVYQHELWLDWAKEAGLLTQKRIAAIDELSAEEMENIDLIEMALLTLQTEINKANSSAMTKYLEDLIENLEECSGISILSNALKKVEKKVWFDSAKKKLDESESISSTPMKKSCAVFLAAWQVSQYMLLIYQDHESPLVAFQTDAELDDKTSHLKQKGNEFFGNREFSRAINQYTSILMNKPYIHILYSNRAQCYKKKQEIRSALSDCRRVVTLEPKWEKGQYLYAQALVALNQKEEAKKWLYHAREICETKADIESLLRNLEGPRNRKMSCNVNNEKRKDTKYMIDSSDSDDNDVPDLEAQSSDEADCNVPDLVMHPDSGEEDMATIESILIKREKKHKEKSTQKTKTKVNSQQKISKEKLNNRQKTRKTSESAKNQNNEVSKKLSPKELKRRDLIISISEGSEFLLDNQYHSAVHRYEKAIDIIKNDATLVTTFEVVVIYYACGVSYLEAGSHIDLAKSLKVFEHINQKYETEKFALSYLGIARTYMKQKMYSVAISPLNKASTIGQKNLTICRWPGISEIIEESKMDSFKKIIKELLDECTYPPHFDAICKYTKCQQKRKGIYFEEPEFKGIYRLVCTEECNLEFHFVCWKRFKLDFYGKKPEKDFSDETCITPDCVGIIKSIVLYHSQIERQDPKVIYALPKTEKQYNKPTIDKSKRMKPSSFKRLEKYSSRQMYRQQLEGDYKNDDIIEELEKKIAETEERFEEEKKMFSMKSVEPAIPPEGELVILNKKNEDNLTQKKKSKKTKSKKAQKQKVKLEIPYNFSKEKESIFSSHFNEDTSFKPPDSLQADVFAFENNWYGRYGSENDINEPEWQIDGVLNPYIIDNKDSIVEGFDFDQYLGFIPEPKETALHVFSMFEQILEAKGWADVVNSPDIMEFLNILDENSRLLIEQVGGLRNFLTKCTRFSFDEENINIVYLTSQKTYYDNVYSVQFKDGRASISETPLFLENMDFQPFRRMRRRQRTDTESSCGMNPNAPEFTPKSSPSFDIISNDLEDEFSSKKNQDDVLKALRNLKPVSDPPTAADRTFSCMRQLAEHFNLIGNKDEKPPSNEVQEDESVKSIDNNNVKTNNKAVNLDADLNNGSKQRVNIDITNSQPHEKQKEDILLNSKDDKNKNLDSPAKQKTKPLDEKKASTKANTKASISDEKPAKNKNESIKNSKVGVTEFKIDFSGNNDSFKFEATINGNEKCISKKIDKGNAEAFLQGDFSNILADTLKENNQTTGLKLGSMFPIGSTKPNKKTGIQLVDACVACANGPINSVQANGKKDASVDVAFKSVLKEAFSSKQKGKKVEIKQIEVTKDKKIVKTVSQSTTTHTQKSVNGKQNMTNLQHDNSNASTEKNKKPPLGRVKPRDVTHQFFNHEIEGNQLIDPGTLPKITVNKNRKQNNNVNSKSNQQSEDALKMPLKEGTPENVPVSICGVKVPISNDIILPNLKHDENLSYLKVKDNFLEELSKFSKNNKNSSVNKESSISSDHDKPQPKNDKENKNEDPEVNLCRIDMGFQVDNIKVELEEAYRKNDLLMKTNKTLIEELKAAKVYISKCDDLRDEMHKQKVKFTTLLNASKNDMKEKEKQLEKLKREWTSTQQSLQSDIKKLQIEKKDVIIQNKALTKKIENSKETEYEKQLIEKDEEIEKCQQQIAQISAESQQEKKNQEEIIQGILNTVSTQRRRAEKVEVALLEVKKNFVTSAYHQRAATVTNVLQRLQLMPNTKNYQKSLKVWNDYKIFFQTCFERMQDEFQSYIQSVMQGTPLEEIPPAKFADPPPFPPMPIFEDLVTNPAPIPMPRQVDVKSVTSKQETEINEGRTNSVSPPLSETQQPIQQAAVNNGAVASPRKDDSKVSPNQIERILSRLTPNFPKLSREDLLRLVHTYLRQHTDVNLSGPRFENVVSLIEVFVRRTSSSLPQSPAKTKQQMRGSGSSGSNNESIGRGKPLQANSNRHRTRANQIPLAGSNAALDTFDVNDRKNMTYGEEEPCVICYEEMTINTSEKLICGHTFHKKCICSWLNEQRTCPVCRNHALLPEEFPALGT